MCVPVSYDWRRTAVPMMGRTKEAAGSTWQENRRAFSDQRGDHLSYRALVVYGHITKKAKQDSAQQMEQFAFLSASVLIMWF